MNKSVVERYAHDARPLARTHLVDKMTLSSEDGVRSSSSIGIHSNNTCPGVSRYLLRSSSSIELDGTGQRVKYIAVELTNVLITNVAPEVHECTLMSEHITLGYSKVKWLYTRQKAGGGPKGMIAGGRDVATNYLTYLAPTHGNS